jgi:CotH kinase protein
MKTAHAFLSFLTVCGVLAGTVALSEAGEQVVATLHEPTGLGTAADGAGFALALQSPVLQPAVPREAHQRQAKPVPGTPAVAQEPRQPKTGQSVVITVRFVDHPGPADQLLLEYQLVDPGKYIARKDAAFEKLWVTVAITNQVVSGAGPGNGSAYSVELPGSLQKHRRLVRYRILTASERKVIAPDPSDAQPNFAYFVYDGVPDWKGAIDPDAREPKVRQVVTYPSAALQRVPVYQLISSQQSVEGATWLDPDEFGGPQRNAYKYTGTMVYEGVVYDHIGLRARGGGWRHAMGKNMWKFNFLTGHRFAARDDYGRPYQTKWDKLNLGACIQQGDYQMRGEQGMFEAVGFRLFNLAGLEAPRTHWVHLRIIDQAEESPADQDRGDFWGLYLAVENVDQHFLKEHDLPAGNLYKIEGGAKTAFNGDAAVTNQSDVRQFLSLSERRQSDSWWSTNVDLPHYYNYRSILECIHHYDVDSGKNYFYFRPAESSRWIVIPWDLDLTWGDGMYGAGYEPFYRAGLLSKPPAKHHYQERLAEIRDLLFNPEQTGWLIDEHAAMISDPANRLSVVDADRAKWDYNHVMESAYVMAEKAGMGRFYFGKPTNDFRVMVNYMKSYLAKRAKFIDSQLLSGYRPPAAPQVGLAADLDFSSSTVPVQLQSRSENPVPRCQWRLAEITDPNSPFFKPGEPWKYEIQSLWEQETTNSKAGVAVPSKLLAPGHIYRIRARWQDAPGSWSRWSAPAQFTVPARTP